MCMEKSPPHVSIETCICPQSGISKVRDLYEYTYIYIYIYLYIYIELNCLHRERGVQIKKYGIQSVENRE